MSERGHEDQFQPTRLSGGCRFGQGTFAEIYGSGRDAPKADREIAQTRTVKTRLTRAIAMGTFGLQLAANRAPEGCRKRGQRTARAIVLDPRVQQDRQAW